MLPVVEIRTFLLKGRPGTHPGHKIKNAKIGSFLQRGPGHKVLVSSGNLIILNLRPDFVSRVGWPYRSGFAVPNCYIPCTRGISGCPAAFETAYFVGLGETGNGVAKEWA